MQLRPAGDNAVLIDLGDVAAAELHAAAAYVRAQDRVLACIAGHSSLYVICDGPPDTAAFSRLESAEPATLPSRTHRLQVQFDGVDFEPFLRSVNLPAADVFDRLRNLRLQARYIGFRGGFAYLDGWPDEWTMPRRSTSRPRVRRGTFAIAGTTAGFYPIDTPGGWNLLGHTDAPLEHAFAAGDLVTIEPVSGDLGWSDAPPPARLEVRRADVISAPLAWRVVDVDWSRVNSGVPPGGPFDRAAADAALSAVAGGVELFECALAGPRLRMRSAATVAWCDPLLRVEVRDVAAGEEVSWGRIRDGLRAYLAIGDRRADAPSQPILRGDRLLIEAAAGPHDPAASGDLTCEVTPQLDRVGIRLRPINRAAWMGGSIPAALRSCGMQFGTVQLHPDGTLVAMGPDHPVTGGYLQPMTILSGERWKLAQLTPGEQVTLRIR